MKWLTNLILFMIAQSLLITLQTSLWMQVLGDFPPPQFWIPAFVYWSLYRSSLENIAFLYFCVFAMSGATAIPQSLLLMLLVSIFFSLHYLKGRVYWSGSTFHMLTCGLAAILFPILHFIYSHFFETNPLHDPEIFYWIVSILMTMLIALPLYRFFTFIDRIARTGESMDSREGFV